ncbi:hypothetical protein VCR1J2_600006 [Vibrio coralliirubri]|nr:hypothetical protein VCR1J2_600006 [Vibrio coralliirubri]CDT92618.1 hypothetical protein VCR8J2_470006 [Vibrio coralliirubri]
MVVSMLTFELCVCRCSIANLPLKAISLSTIWMLRKEEGEDQNHLRNVQNKSTYNKHS